MPCLQSSGDWTDALLSGGVTRGTKEDDELDETDDDNDDVRESSDTGQV